MGDKVILLDKLESMFGMRVRVALAEKGIQYEYKEQDLRNKSPLLLELNPVNKKIPVLIHNGKSVCESMIIVEYIDEVWNDKAPLLPSDPYQKSQAKFWADYIDKKLYDVTIRIWMNNGEKQEAAVKEFVDHLKLLEGELGNKPYFGGETFGFVDISLIGYSTWFYAYETTAKFSVETECPKLIAWVKRCLEKESVSKSLTDPKQVHELVVTVRKRMGLD